MLTQAVGGKQRTGQTNEVLREGVGDMVPIARLGENEREKAGNHPYQYQLGGKGLHSSDGSDQVERGFAEFEDASEGNCQ